MQQRVCLITGGTAGLGRALTRCLCSTGVHVVVLARSAEKGAELLRQLDREIAGASAEILQGDMSDLASVRAAAVRFRERHRRLDILVNNAGVYRHRPHTSRDGHELTFAVNHLAHFELTRLLMPALLQAAPSRVVVVSSELHARGRPEHSAFNRRSPYNGLAAYAQSKLANVLHAFALNQRAAKNGVTVTVLHPGRIATQLAFDGWNPVSLGAWLVRPWMLQAEEAARPIAQFIQSDEFHACAGAYLDRCKIAPASIVAQDGVLQEWLWSYSQHLVGASD